MAVPPKPRFGLNPKGPVGPDPARVLDRQRGALMGLAVGDALGTTVEGRKLVAPPFPALADGPHKELLGRGPFQVLPGQVTEETQLACCLAKVLRTCGGYELAEAVKVLLEFRPHAFSLGGQTQQVLDALAAHTWPERASKEAWFSSQRRGADNGALSRTAPIGVYFHSDPARRLRASLEDTALTHFDPRCQLASAAFNGALAAAIAHPGEPSADELFRAAHEALPAASSALAASMPEFLYLVTEAADLLRTDLALARQPDPRLYGPELHLFHQETHVRTAFRLAFWELAHAPSFEAALVDVANRGGDADGNGAVTGALLGAFRGEKAIPSRWRESVLGALAGTRPSPLRDVYHPRELLRLLDP